MYASSSKRRSYGSWLSGRRAELLKTNSLNRGRDAALEATFLLLDYWLGGNEKPRPNHTGRAEAMKYRPLVRHTASHYRSQSDVGLRLGRLWEMDLIFAQAVQVDVLFCLKIRKFLEVAFELHNNSLLLNFKDTGGKETGERELEQPAVW